MRKHWLEIVYLIAIVGSIVFFDVRTSQPSPWIYLPFSFGAGVLGGWCLYRIVRRSDGYRQGTQNDSGGASGGANTGYITFTTRRSPGWSAWTTATLDPVPQRSSYGEPGEGAGLSEVPDLAEPIIACRSWKLMFDELKPLLCSTNVSTIWRPGEQVEAVCATGIPRRRSDDHPCPVESCRCGIYASKAAIGIVTFGGFAIHGRVKLWGKVIEGDKGYRAQFAYPESLVVPAHGDPQECSRLCRSLEDAYGVPTSIEETFPEWKELGA